MIIFEAMVFICSVAYGTDGLLAMKSCEWQRQGRLFRAEQSCQAALPAVGSPVHSFTIFSGPDGHLTTGKTVDAVRCVPLDVE